MSLFTSTPFYDSYFLERGQVLVAMDPARSGAGQSFFQGRGLLRGVAYMVEDPTHRSEWVGRGYLLSTTGEQCTLLDAVTGKIRTAHADDCVEVEERYRWRPIQDVLPQA